MLKNIFDFLLSEAKWYRKLSGGTWYKVTSNFYGSGMSDPYPEYWVRKHGNDDEILEIEEYN